jgi:beta-lactamase regulating signal transducer with metallopeptidase domain
MFALRGIAVSFSVFLIVYCAASLAVLCSWNRVYQRVHELPMQCVGNLFFALRMFPLALAGLITAAFAVPSFLLLEPRSIVEPMGNIPLALAILGSALAVFGLANAVLALRKASRTVSSWSDSAEEIASPVPFPVLRIRRSVPALTAAGLLRPKILLSGSAEFLLNGNELRTALNHELAHIRRRDNFKKMLLRFVAFPGMRGLEAAWLEASEMAADDAAVSSTADALDLAAALLKLSRLKADEPSPDLTAALVHGHAAIINARVERLISWPERSESSLDLSAKSILGVVLPILAVFAITYGPLLADVHRATEWLIR